MIWTIWINDECIYWNKDKWKLDSLWQHEGRFRDLMKTIITTGERFQIRGFQRENEFKKSLHPLNKEFRRIKTSEII